MDLLLTSETEIDTRRYRAAQLRRNLRQEFERRMRAASELISL